ncbi:aspartate/glutamate racemase family protein [Streptomyces sp. NPDC055134]
MTDKWRRIGIVGGLGPRACAHFYVRLVELAGAAADRDHPEVILLSSPDIPSRLEHLLADGLTPVPAFQHVAGRLEAAGAEVIAIPSVTSQAYRDAVAKAVNVPVVDLLSTVAKRLHRLGVRRPALAVTDGTRRLGLLRRALTEQGLEPVEPDAATQRAVQQCVDLAKAGNTLEARRRFREIAGAQWTARGDSFVIGCTDLSPLLPQPGPGTYDVSDLFAREVLAQAANGRHCQEAWRP